MSKHNAPPVSYPLGRSRLQGQVLLGLWLVGMAAVTLWATSSAILGWRQILGGVGLAAAGAAAWIGWKNSATGQLAWDGQHWRWDSRGYQTGTVHYQVVVALDFQSLLLLRVGNPAQASLWLWAERKACPPRWLDLRRAVFSPHRGLSEQSGPQANHKVGAA